MKDGVMTENHSKVRQTGGLVPASIVIGAVLIICTLVGSATIVKVKGFGNTISVTGAAFKPIKSNLAIWEAEITVTSVTLEDAYDRLKGDMKHLTRFMSDNGFESGDYKTLGVNIRKQYNRDRVETGVILTQKISLELVDVERISELSLKASELIEKGVEIRSFSPRYLFTGLDDLKLEMIKAATENAKLRAQQLAETTGNEVGAPTSARVGVFQIRPLHSQEVSSYGISDVSSIDKEIVCTVHVSFLID